MTDSEEIEAKRRGYWMRRARQNAGVNLDDAAVEAGLKATSGSSVTLWEQGKRPIKVVTMKRLARRYGVPVSLFTNPPMTDDERLAQAIADARELEREDWDEASGPHRQGDDGPAGPRHTH